MAILIIIFFIKLFINFSLQYSQSESTCFTNLLTKLGYSAPLDLCTDSPYFLCDVDLNIIKMVFTYSPQLTNEVIQNTDVRCIGPNLKTMITYKWNIDDNFFDFATESLDYM
ncbi:hypothetical protein DICPUDRAFT_74523 [Dictyostelium purpureum]|uniref:Uncharacterized protein n=1 Tax=Dictyostelium purpureum TaxID=5786 RepID=F0Z7Z6_DICPU|nr:uncharacterized protein DICPUDRAFT_74523 [Dictyostelium purpureum]EGC39900.1 hypothetical protein DICPUDRAFT_74523 [Dictyostelium purpureum]|eukprot:XP_003283529.1 hypothetical protein DICPUDRAFT_74523 [Dictyostelium purpureum]